MTKRKTATHRLIEVKMGGPGRLARHVRSCRTKELSWRLIAESITEKTGIEVSSVSLRNWFPNIP